MKFLAVGVAGSIFALAACASGPPPAGASESAPAAARDCRAASSAAPGIPPYAPSGLTVPPGFTIRAIARVPGAREIAPLPNGDLLVGTTGSQVYIVPDAEAADGKAAGAPAVFATIGDARASSVAFAADRCEAFVGTEYGVWMTPYRGGELAAQHLTRIARVRTGPVSPSTDGDVHVTTSIAYSLGIVYAAVGSSCNACVETDPTRASVLAMHPDGGGIVKLATRIRNAVAIFVNPVTHAVWVGDAGQDDLPFGHPFEFLDDLTRHVGLADYGWPDCEENHHAYTAGADCAGTVEPRAELPAYSTIIGAAFYAPAAGARYAFPAHFRGGIFAAAHGSWHTTPSGESAAASQVAFVSMNGDAPATPVNWNDPSMQWSTFVGGLQQAGTRRLGRPTGVAVGAEGSLFVADDLNGLIYRIRPKP